MHGPLTDHSPLADRVESAGSGEPAAVDVVTFLPSLDLDAERTNTGAERPDLLPLGEAHFTVPRTFCFVDLSGFTAYTHRYGPHRAVERLGEFRRVTRQIAAKRGVRVAKWLGDGLMAVGVKPRPTVALAAHLVLAFSDSEIAVRVGIAAGTALLFEGDDYIGEPVNLAAKLCASARPREILAVGVAGQLPDWVKVDDLVSVDIRGVGRVQDVLRLSPDLAG